MLLYFSPLSSARQFHSVEDFEKYLGRFNLLVEALSDACSSGRILLRRSSVRSSIGFLRSGSNNWASDLSKVRKEQRELFYLLYERRFSAASDGGVVSATLQVDHGSWTGPVGTCLLEADGLIGIGGFGDFFGAKIMASISTQRSAISKVLYFGFQPNCRWQWLPRYEANPKHRKERYFDAARGEEVAGMPLSAEEAQRALDSAWRVDKDYFAKFGNHWYRFKATSVSEAAGTYHGFLIDPSDVPPELMGG